MDVCQVFKYFHPHVGGIEGHVKRLADGLISSGDDVRVLTSTPRGVGGHDAVDGVDVRRVSSLGQMMSVPLAPSHPFWMRSVAGGTDIVHLHLPDPLSVCSYLVANPGPDVLVATYHSDIVKQQRALKLYGPVLERLLDRTDQIITTSPRLREKSQFLRDRSEKCTVVPYGIDLKEFDGTARTELDLPGDDILPVVLFVGRLVYYKGLQYLIKAMSDVEARLLLVGDGENRPELERTVWDRGLDDRVFFLGETVGNELHALYDRADVFALPSCASSEAFAIVQLEAMAYETPIVNTDLPTGVPWVSPDGETGLTVPHSDPNALVSALDRLLSDPNLRREFGQRGRERVEERFTTERMVSQVRSVYEAQRGR
jgi:rhamnosyl/mannosyltransferase